MRNRLAVAAISFLVMFALSAVLRTRARARRRRNRLLRRNPKARPRLRTFPESGTRCPAFMNLPPSARTIRQ